MGCVLLYPRVHTRTMQPKNTSLNRDTLACARVKCSHEHIKFGKLTKRKAVLCLLGVWIHPCRCLRSVVYVQVSPLNGIVVYLRVRPDRVIGLATETCCAVATACLKIRMERGKGGGGGTTQHTQNVLPTRSKGAGFSPYRLDSNWPA
jgi:hypothetical protein